jgi:hypothetical protein
LAFRSSGKGIRFVSHLNPHDLHHVSGCKATVASADALPESEGLGPGSWYRTILLRESWFFSCFPHNFSMFCEDSWILVLLWYIMLYIYILTMVAWWFLTPQHFSMKVYASEGGLCGSLLGTQRRAPWQEPSCPSGSHLYIWMDG